MLNEDGLLKVRHPLNGWVYEAVGDGLGRVTTPKGKTGLFTADAKYVEGDLGDVNPHLCDWVGGRQLPGAGVSIARPPIKGGTGAQAKHPLIAMADMQRDALRSIIPTVADQIADIEFSSVFFTVFPNFHPWGSFNRIVYRFRPNGNNHEECIMECMYLAPIPENGDYSPSSEIHWLAADDDWTDAPELGMLAKVFNQDVRNLPYVQQGLHAMAKKQVQLADYNETKPRHFHKLLEEWLSRP
jgi:hypothetical protein